MLHGRPRGWALAAVGMLLVSTDSFFIRQADDDSWTIAFVFGLASTVSLGGYALTRGRSQQVRRDRGPLAALAVAGAGSQLAFTAAVNHTRVANVVAMVASVPVVVAVLARVVLGERPRPRVVAAIAATTVGIGIVVSGSLGAPTLDGDLLALLAISLFAAMVLVWRAHPDLDRPLALALGSATMTVCAAPLADVGAIPTRVWVAAGLMGLVFNPVGRMGLAHAPRHAPAAEVALFSPVETVAATGWAWLFFDEPPPARTVVGAVVVVAAVAYAVVGESRSLANQRRA